jgi:hypothetical protein
MRADYQDSSLNGRMNALEARKDKDTGAINVTTANSMTRDASHHGFLGVISVHLCTAQRQRHVLFCLPYVWEATVAIICPLTLKLSPLHRFSTTAT